MKMSRILELARDKVKDSAELAIIKVIEAQKLPAQTRTSAMVLLRKVREESKETVHRRMVQDLNRAVALAYAREYYEEERKHTVIEIDAEKEAENGD